MISPRAIFSLLPLLVVALAPIGFGQFTPRVLDSIPGEFAFASCTADFNGNGYQDVAVALGGGELIWYPSTGPGTHLPSQSIATLPNVAQSMAAGDMDGDGDQDLVIATFTEVVWLSHQAGSSWTLQVLVSSTTEGYTGVMLVDLDNDGDLDILQQSFGLSVGGSHSIQWQERLLGGYAPPALIWQGPDVSDFTAVDLDADGLPEVITTSSLDNTRVHHNALPSSNWTSSPVGFETQTRIEAGDLDCDGDTDAVVSNGSYVTRLSNIGGTLVPDGTILTLPLVGVQELADMDGDGSLDLVYAVGPNQDFAWSSIGGFVQNDMGASLSFAFPVFSDMDSDGDVDFLLLEGSSPLNVTWFESPNGVPISPAAFSPLVTVTGGHFTRDLLLTDLTGDGAPDMLAAEEMGAGSAIMLYPNQGNGQLGLPIQLDSGGDPFDLAVVDLNGDGERDLVYTTFAERIVWQQGTPSGFTAAQTLIPGSGSRGLLAVDLTGDSLPEVITADSQGHFYYHSNVGGSLGGSVQVFHQPGAGLIELAAGDVDGDGDLDIAIVMQGLNRLAWLRNDGPFNLNAQILSSRLDLPTGVTIVDLSGDGLSDIVTASIQDSSIRIFRNLGAAGFAAGQVLRTLPGAKSVDHGDMDGDGDQDLLAIGLNSDSAIWLENTDCSEMPVRNVATGMTSPWEMAAADLDGDGDLEVFVGSLTMTGGDSVYRVDNLQFGAPLTIGEKYCWPAPVNSSGFPGYVSAAGNLDVSANQLTLTAYYLPANQFGYFLNSMTQGFIPNPGGGQGNLCLSGAIGRHVTQLFNAGASGSASIAVDLTALPRPTGPAPALAGQTWHFQAWYRDVNPGPTSNHTDGVSLTFF